MCADECSGLSRGRRWTAPARCPASRRGGRGGLLRGRSGLRHEDRRAVVAELLDGLADVGERPVAAALLGRVEVDAGVPPARQLLDRGDVDHPVVQPVVQLGHVAGEEAAVGRDGVAAQRRLARVGHPLLDVREDGLLGLLQRRRGGDHLVGEPGGRVHVADDVGHPLHLLRGRTDDDVDALAEDVQLAVGDQGGDLDEQVAAEVEPGHLAVDPHQPVAHAPPP